MGVSCVLGDTWGCTGWVTQGRKGSHGGRTGLGAHVVEAADVRTRAVTWGDMGSHGGHTGAHVVEAADVRHGALRLLRELLLQLLDGRLPY
eukprot:1979394-Prymnesium_polylepis.1